VVDAKEIWSDADVAGVVICSETNRHGELIAAAAKAKKHMFAEKPLGATGAESREMAAAIEKAGVLFTTGYFMRTNPQHIFLKDQIAQGNFGKITRIRGSNCHNGSLGGWFDTEWRWMADPKIAGVGGFGDLGTHSLDILMWLMGDVDAIMADIKVVTGRYQDCDESGEALIKFKNGATGTLAAGWVDVMDPVTLQISGTEGHAVIINGELFYKCKKIKEADGRKPWKDLPAAPPAPLHQFVDSVAGKKGLPLVTPQEAAARVSVMEAAYKANKSGAWEKPA
jgi:1,5-anhydro-D-fructose reductase (1,5-anhydro-D-mannitol-forming)